MNYTHKLDNLMTITKPYTLGDSFVLLKDSDGWTDGYLADLTATNTESMKIKANCKAMARLVLDRDKAPAIKPLIPDGSHAVENIALDLSDGNAILYNRTVAAKVNPRYLKYFHAAYKPGGISGLVLTAPDKPIKVMASVSSLTAELVGLIMPIKTRAG